MNKWQIELEPVPETGIPNTQHLVLELDPRAPRMSIGPRNRTGGGPEIWQRAVIQVPLDLVILQAPELQVWLESEAVRDHLDRLSAGYRAEMLWSGDFIGHWSEDALSTIDELLSLLGTLPFLEACAAKEPGP